MVRAQRRYQPAYVTQHSDRITDSTKNDHQILVKEVGRYKDPLLYSPNDGGGVKNAKASLILPFVPIPFLRKSRQREAIFQQK
jgi:hypothetical protein